MSIRTARETFIENTDFWVPSLQTMIQFLWNAGDKKNLLFLTKLQRLLIKKKKWVSLIYPRTLVSKVGRKGLGKKTKII